MGRGSSPARIRRKILVELLRSEQEAAPMTSDLKTLMARHARPGRISWIGLRPARLQPVEALRYE